MDARPHSRTAGPAQRRHVVSDDLAGRLLDSAGQFVRPPRIRRHPNRPDRAAGGTHYRRHLRALALQSRPARRGRGPRPQPGAARTQTRSDGPAQVPDMAAMLAAGFTAAEQVRDVLIQAAASAAANDAIAVSLAGFLKHETQQLACIVEAARMWGASTPRSAQPRLCGCARLSGSEHIWCGQQNSMIPMQYARVGQNQRSER